MCKALSFVSLSSRNLYQKTVSRIGRGYFWVRNKKGPVMPGEKMPENLKGGFEKICRNDRGLWKFSRRNPAIATVSERWYGADIAQRIDMGSAADRHRCLIDMSRNDDGGMFRAVLDQYGRLHKTVSYAKDGSSVSVNYTIGSKEPVGLMNLYKKIVRGTDGQKLREVYTARSNKNPKWFYTFTIDAEKGLKQAESSNNGISILKQGGVLESFSRNAEGKLCLTKAYPAGIDDNLQNSLNALKKQSWTEFLISKLK